MKPAAAPSASSGEIERVRDSLRREIATVSERLREALAPTRGAMDALAARLSQLAEVSEAPSRVGRGEEEVVSLGEAAEDTGAEVTDAEVGVFGRRANPRVPSSDE